MKYAAFSFFISSLVTFLVVRFQHLHSHLSADHDLFGVQKFHAVAVPRIGGLGIFAGLVGSSFLFWFFNSVNLHLFLLFLIPASLVFGVGLVEDLTKRVSVLARLIVTMFGALMGSLLINATVRTFDAPVLDTLFQINVIALVFTVVAVAGVANAVNLIDGFNGLAGGVCVLALLSIGIIAFTVGDKLVFNVAMISASAVAGFLILNFPMGKIFLGDGGAYLVGFIIAELSILLNERNPEVSVLFPLMVMIYPIFETIFSIYRRKFIRGQSPGAPDAMHLHQLINKRVVRWRVGPGTVPPRARGNAATSPFLWVLSLSASVPAVIFWNNSAALGAFICLFLLAYVMLYRSIVRFQTPWFMTIPFGRPTAKSIEIPHSVEIRPQIGESITAE